MSFVSTPTLVPVPTRVVEPTSRVDPDGIVVLAWEREGGIVAFCDEVTVYAGGKALLTSCRRESVEEEYQSDAEMEMVSA